MAAPTAAPRAGFDALGEGASPRTEYDSGSGATVRRKDIQGLRALAVLAVVLYHSHVPFVTGGYIGVDVFFVISGFLITSHLVTEVDRTGRVSITGFYARRIRRLLPAALIVVCATVGVSALWGPALQVKDTAGDALYATFYAMNFHLASEGVDYQQANAAPSPFQHFWSLAVEEQFYVAWPLVVLLVAVLTRRLPRVVRTLTLAAVVTVAIYVSLDWSIATTESNAPLAYYSIHTRAWELGVGALVAIGLPLLRRLPTSLVTPLTWVGVALLVAPVFLYDDQTAFPGWLAAIPVGGTALVIAAGVRASADLGAERLLRRRSLQFLGAVSYGWYLWHWPVLILGPSIFGEDVGWVEELMLAVLALWFATLTYLLVEQPAKRLRFGFGRWVAAAAAMSVVVAGASVAAATLAPQVQGDGANVAVVDVSSERELRSALDAALAQSQLPANLTPTLTRADADVPETSKNGCHVDLLDTDQPSCVYGDPDASRTILLFGDSHAEQWFGALEHIAERDHWRLVSWTKVACPLAAVSLVDGQLEREYTECGSWRSERLAAIEELRPDLIVASQADSLVPHDFSDTSWAEGTRETLRTLAETSGGLLFLSDIPRPTGDVPTCLATNLDDMRPCHVPSDSGLSSSQNDYRHLPGRHAAVREAVQTVDLTFVDTQRWLCRGPVCPPVVGNTLVYRDDSHLTQVYARALAPLLRQALDKTMKENRT